MVESLFGAIETKFRSDVSGTMPLFIDGIPQGAFPFCRIVGPESVLERFFDGKYIEEAEIQFSVFADNQSDALAFAQLITTAFDRVSLTMASGACSRFVLVRTALNLDHDDKNSQPIYHARCHFNVRFSPS